jgi:hypothetical protein
MTAWPVHRASTCFGCALLSACMVAFSLALDVPSIPTVLAGARHCLLWQHPLCWATGAMRPFIRARCSGSVCSGTQFQHRTGRQPGLPYRFIGRAFPVAAAVAGAAGLFTAAGMLLLPAAIAGTIAKPWIAPLVKRFGYDRFLLVNTAIVGMSIVSFALITPGWPLAASIVQLAVFGASNSMQLRP